MTELVECGFISMGWDLAGDLRDVRLTPEQLKAALTKAYPDDKPRDRGMGGHPPCIDRTNYP